jgi:hypothetical protein
MPFGISSFSQSKEGNADVLSPSLRMPPPKIHSLNIDLSLAASEIGSKKATNPTTVTLITDDAPSFIEHIALIDGTSTLMRMVLRGRTY